MLFLFLIHKIKLHQFLGLRSDAASECGKNPVKKHQIQPEYGDEQTDGTAVPASRDQILRRERGQRNIHFPCSADHKQDWLPH